MRLPLSSCQTDPRGRSGTSQTLPDAALVAREADVLAETCSSTRGAVASLCSRTAGIKLRSAFRRVRSRAQPGRHGQAIGTSLRMPVGPDARLGDVNNEARYDLVTLGVVATAVAVVGQATPTGTARAHKTGQTGVWPSRSRRSEWNCYLGADSRGAARHYVRAAHGHSNPRPERAVCARPPRCSPSSCRCRSAMARYGR